MIISVSVIFVCVNVGTLYQHLYLSMSRSCLGLLTSIFILTSMALQDCMLCMGVLVPQVAVVQLPPMATPMAQVPIPVAPVEVLAPAAIVEPLHTRDPSFSTSGMLRCNFNKLLNLSSLLSPSCLYHWMALALLR